MRPDHPVFASADVAVVPGSITTSGALSSTPTASLDGGFLRGSRGAACGAGVVESMPGQRACRSGRGRGFWWRFVVA